ncbi:MAG: DUF1552 domain-containing protein [Deltaproteobacteria bacterium]|nr:DUF1552 domain-containing protein [Deltaproteobacteria bacterium]
MKIDKTRPTLGRRTLLRGLVGGTAVSMGLPLLEAMTDHTAEARAGGDGLPRRLITFMFGNGVRLDRWIPSESGPGYSLSEALAPLAAVRDNCSVLSGFTHQMAGANGHDNGLYGSFSGHRGDYYDATDPLQSRPSGPSIDQVVADVIGGETYMRSLHVGNSKRTPGGGASTLSFRGPNQPNPPMLNPQDVFNRLFVGAGADAETRSRILDAVLDDARGLRDRLGQTDRMRLDAHLDSVDRLEQQITAVPPPCDAPQMPPETNADDNGVEPLESVARVMADLVVVALRCDLVRVVTMQQTGPVCQSIYAMTGATLENHSMSHESSPEMLDLLHQAVVVNMEAFAYLLEQLAAEPEGDGSLLDQSVVLLGSDVSEGLTHSPEDMPFIVAGGAGGRLRNPGLHHRDPSRNASDVLLTCAQAVAPQIESIGSQAGYTEQTVAEIMV